jgi:hypothetical protein
MKDIYLNQTTQASLAKSISNLNDATTALVDEYVLKGLKDYERVNVNLDSSGFNGLLELMDATTGQPIVSQNKNTSGLCFTALPNTNYVIRVTGKDANAIGDYVLNTSSVGTITASSNTIAQATGLNTAVTASSISSSQPSSAPSPEVTVATSTSPISLSASTVNLNPTTVAPSKSSLPIPPIPLSLPTVSSPPVPGLNPPAISVPSATTIDTPDRPAMVPAMPPAISITAPPVVPTTSATTSSATSNTPETLPAISPISPAASPTLPANNAAVGSSPATTSTTPTAATTTAVSPVPAKTELTTPAVSPAPATTETTTPTVSSVPTTTETTTPTVSSVPTTTATTTSAVSPVPTTTETTPTVSSAPATTATTTPAVSPAPATTETTTPAVSSVPTTTETTTPTVITAPATTATTTPVVGSTPATSTTTPAVGSTTATTTTITPAATGTAVGNTTPTNIPAITPSLTISDSGTATNSTNSTTTSASNSAPVVVTSNVTAITPSANFATFTVGTNNLLNIQNGGAIQFTSGVSSAAFKNEMGAFIVDDEQGRINGILPGAAGYLAAAMSKSQVIGAGSRPLDFPAGSRLGFYLVQNGTTAQVKADLAAGRTPTRPVFFQTGNTDGSEHLKITQSGNNVNFAWEDTIGGGDRDFNDLIVNATLPASTPLSITNAPGAQSTIDLRDISGVKTASVTVGGSSSYDNFIGFYRVDDASGKIDTLNPGDAGYAQAALGRNVILYNKTAGNATPSIEGGGILAPYAIANGTPQSFLDRNPTNQGNGNLPQAYFGFVGANPDKLQHIQLLGDNKFGFEDAFGGGDRDFNDVTAQIRVN